MAKFALLDFASLGPLRVVPLLHLLPLLCLNGSCVSESVIGVVERGAGGGNGAGPGAMDDAGLQVPDGVDGGRTLACERDMSFDFDFDSGQAGFEVRSSEPMNLRADLDFDSARGNPSQGSLILGAEFSDSNQSVRVGRELAQPLDLSSRFLSALVKLDRDPALSGGFVGSEGTPDPAGGVRLYAVTGDAMLYANGFRANLVTGGWIPLLFSPANPAFVAGDVSQVDSSRVREIGVEFDTASAGQFASGVFHIDSFVVAEGRVPSEPPWTFDCSTEGFAITYLSNGSLAPTLSWDDNALRLEANFTASAQEFGVGFVIGNQGLDFRGGTLRARIRLDDSSPDRATLSANLYVATSDAYLLGTGAIETIVTDGSFSSLTLALDAPEFQAGASYDPSRVLELGVIIKSVDNDDFRAGIVLDDIVLDR